MLVAITQSLYWQFEGFPKRIQIVLYNFCLVNNRKSKKTQTKKHG